MTPNQYTFRYRVRNWSDYNRALIARGRLTFWFDEVLHQGTVVDFLLELHNM